MTESAIIGKSTRTVTVTENGKTKTIVETTIKRADGTKSTTREELHGEAARAAISAADLSREKPKEVKIEDLRKQALQAHNQLRAKHGAPPVKLNKKLNEYAQNYANEIIRTGKVEHSNCMMDGTLVGENIATKSSTNGQDFDGAEVSEAWYMEIGGYDFRKSEPQKGTGHFTQLVWKATQELGVGKAKNGQGLIVVVANYLPPGNVVGKYKENVLPKKSDGQQKK